MRDKRHSRKCCVEVVKTRKQCRPFQRSWGTRRGDFDWTFGRFQPRRAAHGCSQQRGAHLRHCTGPFRRVLSWPSSKLQRKRERHFWCYCRAACCTHRSTPEPQDQPSQRLAIVKRTQFPAFKCWSSTGRPAVPFALGLHGGHLRRSGTRGWRGFHLDHGSICGAHKARRPSSKASRDAWTTETSSCAPRNSLGHTCFGTRVMILAEGGASCFLL